MNSSDFKKTVVAISRPMFRTACAIVGNGDDAKDAVQEALIKLWTHRDRLDRIDNVEAFCIAVLRNECIDMMRHRNFIAGSIDDGLQLPSMVQDDDVVESGDTLHNVGELAGRLSEQQRTVLRMRAVGDMSVKEIGSALNMTETNVCTVLSRARKRLKMLVINSQL
jgi:RNA polymerase sigma factor (sigma-70 family)